MTDERCRQIDALTYSGVGAAAVAAGLVLACTLAIAPGLAAQLVPGLVALAFAGTLVVYNVDRLRDLERDRVTSPDRSRFIERHRVRIRGLTIGAALLCAPLALAQPVAIWGLCGGVAGLGLLHRRLKQRRTFKIAYVTAAWLTVVVGLPAVHADSADLPGWGAAAAWACAICGGAIAANLLVSDLRDSGAEHDRRRLRLGMLLAAGAAALAILVPAAPAGLAAIPAAELLALLGYRRDERYSLVVVDGALLVGAIVSAALLYAAGPARL